MSFGQKLNHWLQSGGSITRLWKYALLGIAITYPIGLLIWEPLCNLSALIGAIAITGTVIGMAGLSEKGRARTNAEEYLKAKEEYDAKKRDGR